MVGKKQEATGQACSLQGCTGDGTFSWGGREGAHRGTGAVPVPTGPLMTHVSLGPDFYLPCLPCLPPRAVGDGFRCVSKHILLEVMLYLKNSLFFWDKLHVSSFSSHVDLVAERVFEFSSSAACASSPGIIKDFI